MELDKRIKEGKRPLTCFDVKEAKEFIGKECYLSNNMGCFSDLNCGVENKEIKKAELTNISNSAPCYEIPGFYYDFCLPCEWVKPEEPKKTYRPYSLAEWIEKHEIGDVINYRSKSTGIMCCHMYMGYAYGKDRDLTKINEGTLTLGVASYTMDYLLEDYEIEVNGEWLPFGVIDEEGAGE